MAPRAKRRLGQHFLSDPRILRRIADAVDPGPADIVLEIGPGPGGLTATLARRAGRVVAIEKDRELVPALRERLPMVSVVEGDALHLDWHGLLASLAPPVSPPSPSSAAWSSSPESRRSVPRQLPLPPGGAVKIAGNIPYNITSPLIDKALRPPLPALIVFLVQAEVADRVTAVPGTPAYGALSVGVQAVARAERLFTVPAGAFAPSPKVDSAVLRLVPLDRPLLDDADRDGFRRFVVGLFGFRRKQLQRGLRELTGADAAQVGAMLQAAELDPRSRPEVLSPAEFVRLYRQAEADRS